MKDILIREGFCFGFNFMASFYITLPCSLNYIECRKNIGSKNVFSSNNFLGQLMLQGVRPRHTLFKTSYTLLSSNVRCHTCKSPQLYEDDLYQGAKLWVDSVKVYHFIIIVNKLFHNI